MPISQHAGGRRRRRRRRRRVRAGTSTLRQQQGTRRLQQHAHRQHQSSSWQQQRAHRQQQAFIGSSRSMYTVTGSRRQHGGCGSMPPRSSMTLAGSSGSMSTSSRRQQAGSGNMHTSNHRTRAGCSSYPGQGEGSRGQCKSGDAEKSSDSSTSSIQCMRDHRSGVCAQCRQRQRWQSPQPVLATCCSTHTCSSRAPAGCSCMPKGHIMTLADSSSMANNI
jgi:hypothetical protein